MKFERDTKTKNIFVPNFFVKFERVYKKEKIHLFDSAKFVF